MQYSAVAVLALAATASATYKNETVSYTTEIVTDYVTYCPAATTLTYGSVTYTASEVGLHPGLGNAVGDRVQRLPPARVRAPTCFSRA